MGQHLFKGDARKARLEAARTGAPCPVCGATEWGTRNRCKACERARDLARRAKDPEQRRARDAARSRAWRAANPEKERAQRLRQDYGLGPGEFERLLAAQDNRCAICFAADPHCIDHCHVTGKVRGILCISCNVGLGQFRDDPSLVLAAAAYVEDSRAKGE